HETGFEIYFSFGGRFRITESSKEPHFVDNRTTIVHLFEWTWSDIAKECEDFLGPQGYGGVQISPPNEVSDIEGGPWWARYQPVSYILISRSGDDNDLADMIKRCNDVGVRIYVDIVVNHMTGYKEGETYGTAGSSANYGESSYPAVPYGKEDFHAPCDIQDYQNAEQVRNCQLVTLIDLDQSVPHVREMIVNYLNKLVDMGVAGFRMDAAKHMWPEDLEAIYADLNDLNEDFGFAANSRPYIYQEVIDLGGEAVKKPNIITLGAVTEFKFSNEIGRLFRNKNSLKYLRNWGPEWSMLPSEDAIVFVDNHDNQRGHGAGGADILTYKEPELYKLALTFMLAHPYGKVTRVMSSYAFTDTDQGPPITEEGNIRAPEYLENQLCDTDNVGWVCEHRWPEVHQMVKFRNVVGQEPLENWWENGENQIAFSRGNLGFVAFNLEEDIELKALLQTGLPHGTYCDILSGSKQDNRCTGLMVHVNEQGLAEIVLPEGHQALAIYIDSKLDCEKHDF
ncbi:alpha-amylase 2-like, partial [Lucilia sericata]|uniref:alpha-amylase 2-like n=1 Tax=Lucilia sericata TaxID=13632 RepID=UPI0018A801AC